MHRSGADKTKTVLIPAGIFGNVSAERTVSVREDVAFG